MSRKLRFRPTLADYAERAPEPSADEPRVLAVFEARPGGEHVAIEMTTFPSYTAARHAAERAQWLADEQSLPQRCYVLDGAGIPVFAAGMTAAGQEEALARQHRARRE